MTLDFDDNDTSIEDEEGIFFDEFEDSILDDSSGGERDQRSRSFIVAVSVLGGGFLIILIALIVFAIMVLPQRSQAQREEALRISAFNTATAQAATMMAITQIAQAATEELTPAPEFTATEDAVAHVVATEEPTEVEPILLDDEEETETPPPTDVVLEPTDTPIPTLTNTLPPAQVLDEQSREETLVVLLTMLAAGGTPTATKEGDAPAEAGASTPVVLPEAMTSTAQAGGITYPTPVLLPDTGFMDEVGLPLLFGGAAFLVLVIFVARRVRLSSK